MNQNLEATHRTSGAGSVDLPTRLPAIVVQQRHGTQVYALELQRQLIVGRDAGADVVLQDSRVSRRHARLKLSAAGIVIEDLGSTNGTWVNGARRERAVICPQDVVVVGGAVLAVHEPGGHCADLAPAASQVATAGRVGRKSPGVEMCRLPSSAMQQVMQDVRRWAPTELPVLITGETGVGKEVVAHQLHAQSLRHTAPFVCLDCAALGPQLAESTLFGHERGAFTGAERVREGIFEAANGGTVFLDEVGELPLPIQAALLRVLETGRFRRLGAVHERSTDVRLVAATNRDVASELGGGAFRRDLFYRLSGVAICLLPLRERLDDIVPLAQHFVAEQLSRLGGQRGAVEISSDAARVLVRWRWPGNARELRHVMRRAAILAAGGPIEMEHFPRELGGGDRAPSLVPSSVGNRSVTEDDHPVQADLKTLVRNYETRLIREHLRKTDGNQQQAARRLGISRRTLGRKLIEGDGVNQK